MKRKIIESLAFLSYWLGVDALFYWLNRKAKRILTFHNVLPDELFRPGVANGVSNRLSDFERIIDECAKRFRFSTDMFEAATITITFDDGYRNQYTSAFKVLQKRGISAYLFVAGDCLDGRSLVIDLLTHWIDNVPNGKYVIDTEGDGPAYEISESNRLSIWANLIWPMFMADTEHKGASVLKACDRAYPVEKILSALPAEYRKERFGGVTCEECEVMRKAGWKIGWHTKSHYPLAKLNDPEVRQELDSPTKFRDVCLSYPYGNPVEVGNAAIKIAEELGYPCAVANTNESKSSRFFLPRISLLPDKGKYRLHFQLCGLEYFIKHRKLLQVYKGEK